MKISNSIKVSAALVIVLFFAWMFLFRPTSLGGPANYLIITGRSMEPTYYDDDFVFTLRRTNYDVGDIVAFQIQNSIVIHRIIGGNAIEGYTIQGDNKAYPDTWHPTGDQIIGSTLFHIPNFGGYLMYLRNPFIFAGIIGVIHSILFIPWLIDVLKDEKRRHTKRDVLLSRRREQELARYLPPNLAKKITRLNNL